MSQRSFCDLAPEVIICVMRSLATPNDLRNFIQTSSINHQIFCDSKSSILEAVIRNAIPSEALPDAIAACDASEVSRLWWKHGSSDGITPHPPPSESFRARRKQFIEAYDRRHISSRRLGSGRVVSLFKLWRITNYFLLDFQKNAFISAGSKFPELQPGWDDPISPTERSWLQRAFFRFEMFRRLFPEISTTGTDALTADAYAQFLDLFSPCEREQLLSVHEYLVSFAKDIYRELQAYLLGRLWEVGNAAQRKAEAQGANFEREELRDIRAGLDIGSLDVFQSGQSLTKRRFQYLVSRGLPFLHWIAFLGPNERILTLDIYHSSDCYSSFFELMYGTFGRHSLNADPATPSTTSGCFGWRWAGVNGLTHESNDILRRHILRQAGYVFWDAKRLIGGWSLPSTSLDRLSLPSRSQDDDDNDWSQEPTLEERFQNIPVPKGFFLDSEEGAEAMFEVKDEFFGEFEQTFPLPFSDEETKRFDIEY